MPTSGIRIVSETNLNSYERAGLLKYDTDEGLNCPMTIDNVLLMENIEPVNTAAVATKTFVNLDLKNWQGGYSTIVSPTSQGDTPVFAELQANVTAVRSRGGRRGTIKEEGLSVEEEERLRLRRERNKQAAARCRKRRVDQTESLQKEVDDWEEKKRLLQEEIHALQTQKEELQFILDAHKHVCNRQESRQSPQRSHVLNVPKVIVKPEQAVNPELYQVHHLTHEEALSNVTPAPTTHVLPPAVKKPSRPASLSLTIRPQSLRSIEGIPIETPTNVFSSLNFDALMDGRTGLTPTNVLTPVSMCSSSSLLQTPTCSTQQRNNSDMLSPGTTNPKLVSL